MPEHKLNLTSCTTKPLYSPARKAELFTKKTPIYLDKGRMSERQNIRNEFGQATRLPSPSGGSAAAGEL